MKQSPLEEKLTELFKPVVADLGYRLVLVNVTGQGGSQTVQVMAENPETRRLGVDECAVISRDISALMDVEDPVRGAYRLEVSSPGISRPLVSRADFDDYRGMEAKITIYPPLEGQKRFRGRIAETNDDGIVIETDCGPVTLEFGAIEKARLVLTDELIAATKMENLSGKQAESGTR